VIGVDRSLVKIISPSSGEEIWSSTLYPLRYLTDELVGDNARLLIILDTNCLQVCLSSSLENGDD
jgi:hypothetical protein